MKIGILQLRSVVGDIQANLERLLDGLNTFSGEDIHLAVTPEAYLTGYLIGDLILRRGIHAKVAAAIENLCDTTPVPLVLGTMMRNPSDGRPCLNAAVFIQRRSPPQYYFKKLLPYYDVFDDPRYFEHGTNDGIFRLGSTRFQVSVCEDLYHSPRDGSIATHDLALSDPIEALYEQGLPLINIAASPFEIGKFTHKLDFLRENARRYQRPLVYINAVGCQEDILFGGRSVVLNAQGELIARCQEFSEEIRVIDLEGEPVEDRIPSNMEDLHAAITMGIHDYVSDAGIQSVWVGLSGGIDSALVAALAVDSLGCDAVKGVLMPGPYTSDHSIEDALALAANLGIQTYSVPISQAFETVRMGFDESYAQDIHDTADENLQARLRGLTLMAYANRLGGAVLATGNKSELAVGYATLYGDTIGALAPIADLYKTQVYSLAKWLNERGRNVIPLRTINKAPSAELKPGQVDSDSLPDYGTLDSLLYELIELERDPKELYTVAGRDLVDGVAKLLASAQFKRQQYPPILKLSKRALSTRSWRYPVTYSSLH